MTKRSTLWRGRMSRALAGVAAVGLVPALALAQSAPQETATTSNAGLGASETGRWIVQLDDPSLATYDGGIAGLSATDPQATGAPKLDVNTPESQAYLAHVDERHDEFADRAEQTLGRDVAVERQYRTVLNAVAIEADQAEAARLGSVPGVSAVYPDQMREPATDVSNDVIGSAAIWDGETGTDVGTSGEDVVVGVLDSGINPEHASFAATGGDGYEHENPLGSGEYLGVCDPSDNSQIDEPICNDKLIGAWAFDYRSSSAVDTDGHGSHTAATAVGNVHDATFPVGDSSFTRSVSGVAPHANLISYRVCVSNCPIVAILSGIDQAITDGVDVINFSISGSDNPWQDPVDQAFLEATNAGTFVAAAAGNAGPTEGTAAHTGPWIAASGASTTDRAFAQTLDVVNGTAQNNLTGVAAVPGDGGPAVTETIEAPILDAEAVDAGNGQACSALPSGAFEGSIALIERGACEFGQKVANAASAGADAVVVHNDAGGPPTTMGGLEGTSIPAVMIDQPSGAELTEAIADAGGSVTARLNPETEIVTNDDWANVMAGFSSRGPSQFDLVAPTLTAPGVNVLAAGAGDADQYDVLQGTSMASPHTAGAGALMTALHPEWSPVQIRSALAGSSDPEALTDGSAQAGLFDQGSGLLDLDAAGRVGLVLDETYENFVAANPASAGDPKSLNLPALVNQECAASCTWTRTVTNVADTEATYTAEVHSPDGLGVTAGPAAVTLKPGESQDVEFTAEITDQPADEWAFARVTWTTDAAHAGGAAISDAQFPVAVIPSAAQITVDPDEITSEQEADVQTEHTVTIGNSGGQDLSWNVAEESDQGLVLHPTQGTSITAVAPPEEANGSDGLEPTRNPQALTGDAVASSEAAPLEAPADAVTMTHSESQEIVANNTVACSTDIGLTGDNGFIRTFTLEDFSVFEDFDVTEVSFGVEAVNGSSLPVTVRLYTLDAEPLTYDNMTEIGNAEVTLEPQTLEMVTVPVSGTAPAGSTLVVELDAPDTSTTSGFYAGSNPAGESAPSYLRSEECGMPEPAPMAELGYPNTHLVMNVTGTTEAPETQLPEWVDVTPTSGTIAAGETQDVTVALDSTGMSAGESHEATLMIESNDPNRPDTMLPISLDVTDDGDVPPDPSEVSEEIVATVPGDSGPGSLVISVDPDDRTVELPELVSAGDRLATDGELRPVTVTDSRVADPGWDASAQVSDFVLGSGSGSFGGGFLGWSPVVESASEGQSVSPGESVVPGFPSGEGLSVPRVLASAEAGAGGGTAVLGAGVDLEVPLDTAEGVYTAILTMTAL